MAGLRFHLRQGVALAVLGLMPLCAAAQEREQTLADIRQELTVLHVEIQRLNRELSTTGAPATSLAGTSVLDRVSAIEAELQRLTAQTETLQHRVQSIVEDGTNRIGDLEFRLVELEGGDLSQLGETSTLGGAVTPEAAGGESAAAAAGAGEGLPVGGAPAGTTSQITLPDGGEITLPGGGELAVAERADFEAALSDLAAESYQAAADKLAAFKISYPGSPLAAQVDFTRGKALDGMGDTREAARAYLAAFTGNATGPVAPQALFELGAALGRLGQLDQACITLSEVGVRFPSDPVVGTAENERARLACS